MQDLPELLALDEFALYLGVGRGLAYNLVWRGALEGVGVDRLLRVPKRPFQMLVRGKAP